MKPFRAALFFAALFSLAGCADQPLRYAAPAGLTAQTGASITGSLVKTGNFANNEKVFIGEVDNKVTSQNGTNSQIPLLVPPGLHVLKIVACECGAWMRSVSGSISIAVNLQAGQTYVARAGVPSGKWIFYAPDKTVMIWLDDGSGKPVQEPQEAMLTDQHPAPVFLPMVVPAH